DAGRVCDEPLILLDLYRTLAQLTGQSLPKDAGEDSFDFSPLLTLLDTSELPPIREHLVHHSGGGVFALRSGPWKLIFGKGSGGFTRWMPPQDAPAGQLYNLDVDPGELNNLYGQEPEVVARLSARMQEIKDAGRSAPLPAD
ncbi:MAG: arylsulfatase A, partial [Candidatus Paceibacteria bacterium]